MRKEKFLLVSAEGHIDEDDGRTLVDLVCQELWQMSPEDLRKVMLALAQALNATVPGQG